MNTEQSVNYLLQVGGVEGCIIQSAEGEVIAKSAPDYYVETMINSIVENSTNILNTFRTEMGHCDVLLDMDLRSLYVKDLNDQILYVIISDKSQVENVRTACNVIAQSYVPSSKPDEKSEEGSLKSFFGKKTKKNKPPQDQNDIWGG